jgi:hypothetical protein
MNYLLGLLNSGLLNWGFKLTSTNNYLSAAEILALPAPRISKDRMAAKAPDFVEKRLPALLVKPPDSITDGVRRIKESLNVGCTELPAEFLPILIDRLVKPASERSASEKSNNRLSRFLEAAVLLLFGLESFAYVFEE